MTYQERKACYRGKGIPSENQSSIILGDPPPDPRFLTSLGALSLVGIAESATEGEGWIPSEDESSTS
jgi:hypothetical protein